MRPAESLMQHGQDWRGQNVTGWHLSEKLEGCRAYWNGATLWSKSGHVLDRPTITALLPVGVSLDGELWAGRGQFEIARLFTQYGRHADRVTFVCFDAPNVRGDWPERVAAAQCLGVTCVTVHTVGTMQQLASRLNELLRHKGEGFMVRRPGLAYTPGRTDGLLKVKSLDGFQ